jgi:hypothetical protein
MEEVFIKKVFLKSGREPKLTAHKKEQEIWYE